MSTTYTHEELVADEAKVAERIGSLKLLTDPAGREQPAKYPHYLPVWEQSTYPDWEPFEIEDAGHRGTPDKRHLLGLPGAKSRIVTPAIGIEIEGVQISELTKEGLDDLALLAAERGLVIFRNQDFKDIGFDRQREIVRHYGPLHIHPTMGHPEGVPEMHVVFRSPTDNTLSRYVKPGDVQKISSVGWHIDHTAERNIPALTFFFGLEVPEAGGDTLFVSLTEAYKRLSPDFRDRLEGLRLVHSNAHMLELSKSQGGPARFSPQTRTHPLIRTHPVTKENILYFQNSHAHRVDKLKQEESDYLFKFFEDILLKSGDFQTRVRYEDGTVAVWDNRVVAHSATFDFKGDERRHVVRIAALGEIPFGPDGKFGPPSPSV